MVQAPGFRETQETIKDDFYREIFDLPAKEEVEKNIQQLKNILYQHAINYLKINCEIQETVTDEDLNLAAKIALGTAPYNQAYLLSRLEAVEVTKKLNEKSEIQKDEIQDLVAKMEPIAIPAINVGYYLMVQRASDIIDENGNNFTIEDKPVLVPRQGFGVTAKGQIYFNSTDFEKTTDDFFNSNKEGSNAKPKDINIPHFDLHDLVHYGVGAGELKFASHYYGFENNKGQTVGGLQDLPQRLRLLIISAPKKEVLKSDGHILSNLTFNWFYEKFVEIGSPNDIDKNQQKQIVGYVSDKVSEYLLQNYIQPCELAILMQNKLYEATASECETAGFVRGGKGDPFAVDASQQRGRPDLDPLLKIEDPVEKVKFIANLANSKTHHEHRNTLRNRAQTLGYIKTAEILQKGFTEKMKLGENSASVYWWLCQKIKTSGQRKGGGNLFDDVYKILNPN
jgi:hypothetical protein